MTTPNGADAFISFASEDSCFEAYRKMNNVLIDDRRIKVDFSQSVSGLWNRFNRKEKFNAGDGGGSRGRGGPGASRRGGKRGEGQSKKEGKAKAKATLMLGGFARQQQRRGGGGGGGGRSSAGGAIDLAAAVARAKKAAAAARLGT